MIYEVDSDYHYHDKLSEKMEIPEVTAMLLNIFDIEHDDLTQLSNNLRVLFLGESFSLRDFLEQYDLSYASLIFVSRDIDPDFWDLKTVKAIQLKHKKLIDELDENGCITHANACGNIGQSKKVLLRYFDLLPEEDDHDDDLGKVLLKTIKNKEQLLDVMEITELNASTLLHISHILSPKFWSTNTGRQLRNKTILIRF